VPDLLAAVGRAEVPSADVLKACFPDYREERAARQTATQRLEGGWFSFAAQAGIKFHGDSDSIRAHGLPIRTVAADLPVRFAPDGGAVPATALSASSSRRSASPSIQSSRRRWSLSKTSPIAGSTFAGISTAKIRSAFRRAYPSSRSTSPARWPALPRRSPIATATSTTSAWQRRTPDFHEIVVDLEVWDIKHLTQILNELRVLPNVSKVERVNG
jgi:Guanosine polyphosphate pyrophosphohydrolases/synthetases